MKKMLALVCACAAVVGSQVAFADQGNTSAVPVVPASDTAPCTPMKALLSWKNWRDPHPLAGENPCPNSNRDKLMAYFRLYRHYRQIAPYRCTHGREAWWAKPCYVMACESGFSWTAANPSGAVGPYQLLGWGAPYPARTFKERVRNHEIAASLSLSNWVCA